MITEQDLQQAITECLGQRNPTANTCIKLAAFYTIRNELRGEEKNDAQPPGYSFQPDPEPLIRIDSGSDFARMIDGRRQAEIWPLLDELMDTIHAIHPRLYAAAMERLR